jgi:predicted N-acetyltransferase YhbS
MSITDIIIAVIIRSATTPDLAAVQRICASVLDLEPDASDLPAILAGSDSRLAVVAETHGDVIGACYGSLRSAPDGRLSGHVDLLVVARQASGRGVGLSLLARMEELLAGRGATDAALAGNPPVYLWPGVDARYTAMTCLAARTGYERYAEAVDMAVQLGVADLECGPDIERLAAAGVTIRRAERAESERLLEWLRAGPWGHSSWPEEVAATLTRQPAGCHVACRGERYVGFACHGSVRRGWFGPMGTLESERRHGIGSVLLRCCLSDMKAAGMAIARVGWVGPVRFYARGVGARVERVYWLYRKAL